MVDVVVRSVQQHVGCRVCDLHLEHTRMCAVLRVGCWEPRMNIWSRATELSTRIEVSAQKLPCAIICAGAPKPASPIQGSYHMPFEPENQICESAQATGQQFEKRAPGSDGSDETTAADRRAD